MGRSVMGDHVDLGERIRQLRGRLMSQRELADRAQVSVDLIRKLEQGRRHTASIGSLQRIAEALDVTIAELVGKRTTLRPSATDGGVVDIRRALTPVDDLLDSDVIDGEPLSLSEAERTVDYLWGAYWAGRYELLGSLLPNALTQLRATHHAAPTDQRPSTAHVLARAYQAAGDTLVHLGHQDAAFLAVREALRAARETDDVLLYAAMRVSVAWQLLVQGRYTESEQVAVIAARDIEPSGAVSESQLSGYGILTATAATAAARARKSHNTSELLAVAGDMAGRIRYERTDHQTTFGPAKVAMMTVDCAVVQDEFAEALGAARGLPRDATLPLASRARHLADVALAQLRLGHSDRALNTVLTMEQMAPDWIRYQSLPRQVVTELVEHERRVSAPLRDLAMRLGATER
ncbi:helix-turn-helix domain-containing protein [Amycolatopsis cihanbeyliensis]|uniref:Transcriptional regulator with XRE-family HTH domain n=1 Tax=Amycolatopsis cihanbeyliensis TaxID=1128664 RepID=A0A542DS81_AMYCI|nr:helix-turn-helix domain-containing protein [Amycolatopsis cihanbeyliensis]TQJ05836.1 transcriptional regulator with XRE-family HTH domain [Amycolatopsis cihanbeyliensis]